MLYVGRSTVAKHSRIVMSSPRNVRKERLASVNEDEGDAALEDNPTRPLIPADCSAPPYSHLAWLCFYLLGIGTLLPWYFLITAKGYWDKKFNGEDNEHGKLAVYFESYISIASTAPNVLFSILGVVLVNKLSANWRVHASLFVIALLLAVTVVLVKVDTTKWRTVFFTITLLFTVVISGSSMVFMGTIFGLAGQLPSGYSQAVISGQAMGGTLSALLSILDLAVADDITNSALVYFVMATAYTIFCMFLYSMLCRLPIARYYFVPDGSETNPVPVRNSLPPIRMILHHTRCLGFCVFYCFLISISLFPAVLSNIEPTSSRSKGSWLNKYFAPVCIFLLYNVADLVGRTVAGWVQWPSPHSHLLLALTLLRTVFIPLTLICHFDPRSHLTANLLSSDIFPILISSTLGLSNGYLGSLALAYGPKAVPPELTEATGVALMVFLACGLAAGSLFSVLLVYLI
uniref:equilibrative nucleoside transporter 3 isoform X2 n=1 Tax=Myxine glutinosa TaxID=7769 RepID=UPI00358FB833